MNPVLPLVYLVPLLAAVAAAALAAAWRSTAGCARRVRVPVLACRGLALLALAAIALDPGVWRQPVRRENRVWALLLDRSASMATPDADGVSRWQHAVALARQAVNASDDPQAAVPITFSDRLEQPFDGRADAASAGTPDGASTDLLKPLRTLLDRYDGSERRLAGILILSDGRHLGAADDGQPALRARAMGAPVFALAIGGEVARRDLAVSPARLHYVTFVGQKTPVTAWVENHNLGEVRVAVRLADADGRDIASRDVLVRSNARAPVEFSFQPEAKGYRALRFEVQPWPGETTTENNAAVFGVTALSQPMRILFVEGSPHWDSKFLVQLLRQQPHMQVTTVHRVTGERFFRVETKLQDAAPTLDVFPDDPAALNAWDAIAFGKGAEYFLTPDRAARLRSFVSERGGRVLFCRGKPYFGTFADLEPLEPVEWGAALRVPFRWQPTAAAAQLGLTGVVFPAATDPVWPTLPPVDQAMECPVLKPFAQVLIEGATADAHARRVPVLVSRRVGNGLAVALNAEGLWRWDFFPAHTASSALFRQFWVELFQWAVTQSDFLPGQRLALRVEPASVPVRAAVKFVVRASEPPSDAAALPRLDVYDGARRVESIGLSSVRGRPGEWSAIFTPGQPGTYRVEAALPRTEGPDTATATLDVRPPPGEATELSADPAFLSQLAEASGGRLIRESELTEVVRSFAPREVPTAASRAVWQSRWDRAWLLLAIAGVLTAEWFMRRRNGLL